MSQQEQPEPIKYGDILPVSGELASKPVAMKDADALQSEESRVVGETTQEVGAAAIIPLLHSAAALNESRAAVQRDQMTDVVRDRGVEVREEVGAGGAAIVTEKVGGEVVVQYAHPWKGKSNTAPDLSSPC
nr:late embryogenesis abundant protein 31-like [Ipomoea trifida]